MEYRVIGKVAILQADTVLGLSEDQYRRRRHLLDDLGSGQFRVTGSNVKFKFGETIDVIDGAIDRMGSVMEPTGKTKSGKKNGRPGPDAEMKRHAKAIGVVFGAGVGEKTLSRRIAAREAEIAKVNAAARAKADKAEEERAAGRAKKAARGA